MAGSILEIKQDIIEESPINEPASWVSNAVIDPKLDRPIRMTLDACNANKIILPTNHPIPRHKDKPAFWRIELDETSCYLTVFHANDKHFRYKMLTMGLKPLQGELNVALKLIFAHINSVYLIHDDVIIATKNISDSIKAVSKVMEAVSLSRLTLNPDKCHFGCKEIKFWGMIYSAEGMKPDPAKVDALKYISPTSNKDDCISFLCMMQSNADFTENFAQKATQL